MKGFYSILLEIMYEIMLNNLIKFQIIQSLKNVWLVEDSIFFETIENIKQTNKMANKTKIEKTNKTRRLHP